MTKFCQFSQQNEMKKKKAIEKTRQEQKTFRDREEDLKSNFMSMCRFTKGNRRVDKEPKEITK